MKKSLKIIIGLLLSIFLFYLFIKDVNTIKISQNSGKFTGDGVEADRVVFLEDVQGFQPGEKIVLFTHVGSNSEEAIISSIHQKTDVVDRSFLLTESVLKYEYQKQSGAYLKYPRLQKAFKNAQYIWLAPALIFTLLGLMIRAYRWKFFFPNYQTLSFNGLWVSVCIGYMANNVLPFRMGELIRAWILGKKEKRGISESFGTIVMERIFDIVSILVVFVGFIFYFAAKKEVMLPSWIIDGAWVLAGISILALISLISLHFRTDWTLGIVKKILSPLPQRFSGPLLHAVESFINGLSIFSDWSALLRAFFLSMVIWLDLAIAYYFIFLAVHIDATLLISIFLIVALAFAVSIPSAPGFIGTFHWVGKEVLIIMGLKGNIEAYVLLAHAMAYIPVVIIGFLYLSVEKLSLRDLLASIRSKDYSQRQSSS